MNDFEFASNDISRTVENFSKFAIVPIIIGAIFFVVIFIVVVVLIVKSFKKSHVATLVDKTFQVAENKLDNILDEQKSKSQPQSCEYCGTVIPAGKHECGSCGAKISLKESKK